MNDFIKLSQFLAISDLDDNFLWLKKSDNFTAAVRDITDLSIYYDYLVTNVDYEMIRGAGCLILTILEPETADTYFHPDNHRLDDDLR